MNIVRLSILSCIFCLNFFHAGAQRRMGSAGSTDVSKKKGWYLILYVSAGQTQTNNPGSISAMFNYRVHDLNTGQTNDYVFQSAPSSHYSQKPLYLMGNFEVDYKSHCFMVNLGGPLNYTHSSYGSFGYGYAFDLRMGARFSLTLKPSLSLVGTELTTRIGQINNEHCDITALDNAFDASFTVTHHGKYHSYTNTYDARTLNVYSHLDNWLLNPMLTICNDRKQRIYWGLNIGWQIPVYQKASGITLEQTSGSATSVSHQIYSATDPDLAIYKDNAKTTRFPFSAGGPFLGLSLGVYLNK
ncbi:MAG: hypothetical protein JST26_11660 [Bacteroidetes bacterium]|nr:hypothetical protein [Bacteroidota bacterium]